MDTDQFTDRQVLARTIWGESRNQATLGQIAVACVVVNRAKLGGWWGHDIRSVCLKPFQFSCWNENDPNRPKMMAVIDSDIITQLTIADQAIAGNLVDVTGGADSYIVRGLTADWMKNLVPCSSIGAHDFYQTK